MQIHKTKDYSKFKLRDDNRAKISHTNISTIVESIKKKNMLYMVPILVNGNMEIIQGQHRYLAAKQLGVDIYYTIEENITPEDILKLNIGKAWTAVDYLNFFIKNGYQDYRKLREFILQNGIPLNVALNLKTTNYKLGYSDFKAGKFIFSEEDSDSTLKTCQDIMDILKSRNGFGCYMVSGRFWKALTSFVASSQFKKDSFIRSLNQNCHKIHPARTKEEYFQMFSSIQQWGG